MPLRLVNAIARSASGIAAGIRRRPGVFWSVALGVFVLDLILPVVVLSLARKPADFFTLNPWLSRLPEYLVSGEDSLARKLEFLSGMAIAWFSADNPVEGLEWGFVIDVPSLTRMALTSLLFGAYFATWVHLRERVRQCAWTTKASPRAGAAGVATSVLGFTTAPCSVTGCGVPVLPVVGLAVTGVSTDTLRLFADVSRVAVLVVLAAVVLGTAWLGWLVSVAGDASPKDAPSAEARST